MKNKLFLLSLLFFVCILSISAISAAENTTSKDVISTDNNLETSIHDDVSTSINDDELILDNELERGANNLTLRKRLPFEIDILETDKILKSSENNRISNIETIAEIGYIKLNIDEKESKIFRDGKISISDVKNKKEAKEALIKILPLLRRTV